MHEWSEAGNDASWAVMGWTPRARRLLGALLWTVAWLLILNGARSVLPALQGSIGEPSCRGPRACVAVAAPDVLPLAVSVQRPAPLPR